MDLFTLSKYFGDRYEIFDLYSEEAEALESGDFISLYGDEAMVARVGRNDEACNVDVRFLTDADKRRYRDCVKDNRLGKFCRVLEKKGRIVSFGMLYGARVEEERSLTNETMSIAVLDSALEGEDPDDFEYDFFDNYCYTIDGESYYLFGKSIYSGDDDSSFILVDVENNTYLTVNFKSVAALFPEVDDKSDNMLVIEARERRLTQRQRFSYSLHNVDIEIVDKTKRKRASALAEEFIRGGNDKYIGLWKRYAEVEYNRLEKAYYQAGELQFSAMQNKGDNDYVFDIENAARQYEFIRIANEFFGGKVTVTKEGSKYSSVIARGEIVEDWGDSSDAKSRIRIRTEEPITVSGKTKGTIQVDIIGSKRVYKRRIKALDAILSGTANNPCLSLIVNGKTAGINAESHSDELNPDILREIFGEKGPNKSQEAAIRAAINTPDYAIIQGPPGTGKTRVIQAILSHFQAESGLSRDKRFLVTAYQNDATRNATAGMNDYLLGLPIFSSAGKDSAEKNEYYMEDWCRDIRSKVLEHNPLLSSIITKREKLNKLNVVRNTLMTKCSLRTACDVLKQALAAIDEAYSEIKAEIIESKRREAEAIKEVIEDEISKKNNAASTIETYKEDQKIISARREIERIGRVWKQALDLDCTLVRYYISLIPVSPKCLEDDGVRQLQTVVNFFNSGSGYAYRNIFDEELSVLKDVLSRAEWGKDEFVALTSAQIKMATALGKELSPDEESVKRAMDAIDNCKDVLDNVRLSDKDEIILDYITDIRPTVELYDAISKYGVSYSATHQKALSTDYGFYDEVDSAESMNKLPVYDDVLVDEAARSCPPDLMIPLACARKRMILVGDDKQLPQFLNEDTVKNIGLEEEEVQELTALLEKGALPGDIKPDVVLKTSMFEYLAKRAAELKVQDGNERVIMLSIQYRMPPVLGNLISRHFYNGELKNGIEDAQKFAQHYSGIAGRNMVWLKVSSIGKRQQGKHSYFRPAEIDAILNAIKRFTADVVKNNNGKSKQDWSWPTIGVIAAYKAQANKIAEQINAEEWKEWKDHIEVGTVDSFQGKEFDIVFFSMVRTDGEFGFMNIESDKNGNNHSGAARTCVALSRAKKCMIIVGDDSVLVGKNKANAQKKVPAIVDFYQACCDKREDACGFYEEAEKA